MKPLKIVHVQLGCDEEFIMFALPTNINKVFKHSGLTCVSVDGVFLYTKEHLLNFVKRWEEALADIDSRILMLLTRR